MRLRDGLGAYFGCSLVVVEVFIAILSYVQLFLMVLVNFLGGGTPHIIDFIEKVIIFEVFLIFVLSVVLGLFRWPLGPS